MTIDRATILARIAELKDDTLDPAVVSLARSLGKTDAWIQKRIKETRDTGDMLEQLLAEVDKITAERDESRGEIAAYMRSEMGDLS